MPGKPTSNTIFLFWYFSFFLFVILLGFLIEMYLFSEYINMQIFQKKNIRKIPVGLSLLTVFLSLITMVIAIILLTLELVGISKPTLVSEIKGGIRVSYLQDLRDYFSAALKSLIVAIVILHIGSFLVIAYHTRHLRPLKDIARVYNITLSCSVTFLIVAFILVGEDLSVAIACFDLVVTIILIFLMIVSGRTLIVELDMQQKSGVREDLTRIKRNVLEISLIVLLALFCSIFSDIINLVPPQYHRPFWKIAALVISIFVAAFLPITLAHNANTALLINLNEIIIQRDGQEPSKRLISKLTLLLLFRKRNTTVRMLTKKSSVRHEQNYDIQATLSEEKQRDTRDQRNALELT